MTATRPAARRRRALAWTRRAARSRSPPRAPPCAADLDSVDGAVTVTAEVPRIYGRFRQQDRMAMQSLPFNRRAPHAAPEHTVGLPGRARASGRTEEQVLLTPRNGRVRRYGPVYPIQQSRATQCRAAASQASRACQPFPQSATWRGRRPDVLRMPKYWCALIRALHLPTSSGRIKRTCT